MSGSQAEPELCDDIFDAEDLLSRMMQMEDLARMVAAGFLKEAPRQFAAMVRAVEEGNTATVAAAAHSLKGASGNAGAHGVYRLTAAIEAMARQGKLPCDLLAELGRGIDAVRGPIEVFLDETA